MFGARFLLAALVVASPSFAAAGGTPAPAPSLAPLDYKAYDSWNAIRGAKLSDDGKYLAYALVPEDGDPVLVVRNLGDGSERRQERATAPAFAASGRYVVATLLPPKHELDAARRSGKPAAEQPKNGLAILAASGSQPSELVATVRSVQVARNGGPVIAYLAEASPAPSPAPSARAPGASPAPSPSPSPSPNELKTKASGAQLTIRDLDAGWSVALQNVTEYALSDGDDFVAYATETKDGSGDGLYVYDVARRISRDVMSGPGRYRNIAIARDSSSLAFLSDAATFAQAAPHDALYLVDLRSPNGPANPIADSGSPGLSAGEGPSANGTVRFSRDGKRLFFGTAAVPTPLPSGTPEPLKVDVWTWHDDVLQSQQKHDADQERKRTYLADYEIASARTAQLGSKTLEQVFVNENPDVALGFDERPYRRSGSWLGRSYADVYAVALEGGARRKLAARSLATETEFSPDGRYAVSWDEAARHWFALRTSDGRRVELARNAGVRFEIEDDDHPEPPQPYGFGGWLGDDRPLLYDRYDVWSADPQSGLATNLTGGAGRRARTVFSPVQPDPEALAFAADEPILLSLLDERTLARGFARVAPPGGTPQTLLRLDESVNGRGSEFNGGLHDLGDPPLVAKHAPRYVFRRETFGEFPDLWSSDASFAGAVRVTDANPQRTHYRWGTERLIAYRSADGTPLRAIMLVPEGLQKRRAAPMLVYFYERFTPFYHHFWAPAPGTSPNFSRYVSNGYVVLLPDVHYRPGHPGPSAVESLMPAVDAALRTGLVDPARIGIAGHSWAAYQINYLLTKVHRFRAAEAGAAVDDMFGAYGGIRLESGVVRESQYEHGQSRIGATPWERPDLYLENSGLFGIENVTTPYLTIHNDLDGAVPQFEGIEFVTAMRRLGKEAYLFSFEGEDHNLRGREQQKYWTVALDEWFDYWLKGAPRPAWFDGVDYLQRGRRDVRPLFGESDAP